MVPLPLGPVRSGSIALATAKSGGQLRHATAHATLVKATDGFPRTLEKDLQRVFVGLPPCNDARSDTARRCSVVSRSVGTQSEGLILRVTGEVLATGSYVRDSR